MSASETYYSGWYDLLPLYEFSGEIGDGGYVIVSSRLFSRETVATNYSQVARNAVVETVCGVSWDESTSTADVRGPLEQLREWIQETHDVMPNDGAYLSEVCWSC